MCPATEQRFFGWRLHIIDSLDGLPVAFDLLSARYHDLPAVHELTANFAPGKRVLGDEASIDSSTGVRFVPTRKKNMQPHRWADEYDLRRYRTLKPSTANWSTWAFNAFMPVPMPVLNSKSLPRSLPLLL